MKKALLVFMLVVLWATCSLADPYYGYITPRNSKDGKVLGVVDVCGTGIHSGEKIPVNIYVHHKPSEDDFKVAISTVWIESETIKRIKDIFPKANFLYVSISSAPKSVCQ